MFIDDLTNIVKVLKAAGYYISIHTDENTETIVATKEIKHNDNDKKKED